MPNPRAVTVHFDYDGKIISAEYPDGTVIAADPPPQGFDDAPLRNINLLRVEALDILVWEERNAQGELVRKVVPHWFCRRYCEVPEELETPAGEAFKG